MTRADDFQLENGAPQKVMMMHNTEYFPYAEHEGTQIVDLPYWGGMRMRVFLPGREKGFRQFCRDLRRVPARFLNGAVETHEVSLSLPRFRIESDVDCEPSFRPWECNAFSAWIGRSWKASPRRNRCSWAEPGIADMLT